VEWKSQAEQISAREISREVSKVAIQIDYNNQPLEWTSRPRQTVDDSSGP
jgi:hypothetical protein